MAGESAYADVRDDLCGRLHRQMTATRDLLLRGAVTPLHHRATLAALTSPGRTGARAARS